MKLWMTAVVWVMTATTIVTAQTKPEAATGTVVTSDQFKLDMAQRQGLFTGNVAVTGTDFKMKAGEMTVYFGVGNNRIERLVAKGDVTMEQPNRTAKSSQMEYIVGEDKMILTGSPEVVQDKNRVTGTSISIYRGTNRMDVDGRSRVLLYDDLKSPAGAGGAAKP